MDLSRPSVEIHSQEPVAAYSEANNTHRALTMSSVPLRRGYGTHIAYLWVGTPPRRVSVIVDTGSHQVAFPCTGCKNCGHHIDSYFDPKESETSVVDSCVAGRLCSLEQHYTEGSSWAAYTLSDMVRLGGEAPPSRNNTAARVQFGCQSTVTGLFRTQLANGIMGLSAHDGTLPHVMHRSQVTREETFGLCFRHDGGVMTLGGVDPRLFLEGGKDGTVPEKASFVKNVFAVETRHETTAHSLASPVDASSLVWAKLMRRRGWYVVRTLNIFMTETVVGSSDSVNRRLRDIGASEAELNTGKGTILDSGTTDTFMPQAIATRFKRIFRDITGIPFQNKMILTELQRKSLPDIVIRMRGVAARDLTSKRRHHGDSLSAFSASFYNRTTLAVDVTMTSADYLRHIGGDEYALNVYLSEQDGLVLGANFMNRKVCFTPKSLIYSDINPLYTS